ncbi:hypothetical protein [Haloactinospora alba]|uniref:hypothetical protein n=1 Tax=Haloactinospora alba TaxID=405555 RepID=UPI001150B54D|nr:hypothetical protein [Haloactinospora alba]
MSGETSTYLMVLGDRDALGWVLSTRQTAFPERRRRDAASLRTGDELLVYTTRGCFGNPTRDRGRIVARAAVAAAATRDEEPVRFGERSYPWRCPLDITELAPFRTGVVLADHVHSLRLFPKPENWSVYLRRPLVPLARQDRDFLVGLLAEHTQPVAEVLPGYPGTG